MSLLAEAGPPDSDKVKELTEKFGIKFVPPGR